jgi:hypothetical protein
MSASTPEQPDGRTPCAAQRREDVGVDLAGEDHLGHVERLLVGDAAALDHRGREAEALADLGGLRPAAVHHDQADAHVRAAARCPRPGCAARRVAGDLAARACITMTCWRCCRR